MAEIVIATVFILYPAGVIAVFRADVAALDLRIQQGAVVPGVDQPVIHPQGVVQQVRIAVGNPQLLTDPHMDRAVGGIIDGHPVGFLISEGVQHPLLGGHGLRSLFDCCHKTISFFAFLLLILSYFPDTIKK